MCHISDPFGFSLELLQHDFKSNFSSERIQASLEPNLALGQQAYIGLISLRVCDINRGLSTEHSKHVQPILFSMYRREATSTWCLQGNLWYSPPACMTSRLVLEETEKISILSRKYYSDFLDLEILRFLLS